MWIILEWNIIFYGKPQHLIGYSDGWMPKNYVYVK